MHSQLIYIYILKIFKSEVLALTMDPLTASESESFGVNCLFHVDCS